MDSVSGLHAALSLCASDSAKDRARAHALLPPIFANAQNLRVFQAAAATHGGAPWLALFHCLFRAVALEKRAVLRGSSNAQAAARLAHAIRIVRLVAEQAVHLIARKPLIALVAHMRHQLVLPPRIFAPALLDYSKALSTLLAYPPHVESLDRHTWLALMSMCFAAILGDDLVSDDQMDDADMLGVAAELERLDAENVPPHRPPVTLNTSSLVQIIPALLCSTVSPIVPPTMKSGDTLTAGQKVGLGIVLKIRRFFTMYPHVTIYHLHLLTALNTVLSDMELNCRDLFLLGSVKIFPHLVTLWAAPERDRDRRIPEQIAIAIHRILPHLAHSAELQGAQDVTENVERLMEMLAKESTMSRGIEPLDLGSMRLKTVAARGRHHFAACPFETRSFSAGHHFTVDHALSWTAIEIYCDACLHLYQTRAFPSTATPSRQSTPSKRRKLENPLASLVSAVGMGRPESRLIALQTLVFVIDRHWSKLAKDIQSDIRRTLVSLLTDDSETLQSWAYIALSTIILSSYTAGANENNNDENNNDGQSQDDWKQVWSFALRKCHLPGPSRSASHAAAVLLQFDKVDSPSTIRGIQTMLTTIAVQGPPTAHDSVCALYSIALEAARSDIQLYSLNLEEQVLSWLEKTFAREKFERDKMDQRLDQATPGDILRLFSAVSRIQYHVPLAEPVTKEFLPDSAVVSYALERAKTQPIRDFLLYHTCPTPPPPPPPLDDSHTTPLLAASENHSTFLGGRPRRLSELLLSILNATTAQWETKPVISSGERPRRCVDLVALGLAFQGLLQLDGYIPHAACINAAIRLLHLLKPSLTSSDLSIPSLDLVWRGLRCLADVPLAKEEEEEEEEDWPILVKPDVQSGIRQDLLPPTMYDTPPQEEEAESSDPPKRFTQYPPTFPSTLLPTPTPITPSSLSTFQSQSNSASLVHAIWRLPDVSAALQGLFSVCLQVITRSSSSTSSGQPTQLSHHEDDDGEDDDDDFAVASGETTSAPLPEKAAELRASTSLLRSAVAFRLQGVMLVSAGAGGGAQSKAYKDTQLVNSFLQADGLRAVEIGWAICEAMQKGWLRLGIDAVDLVVASLGNMLNSYGYARDERLLQLCLEFLKCSAPVWMGNDHSNDDDLKDEAMRLVCYIATKITAGSITSWRVRLAMLRFIEAFLHYDSASKLWADCMVQEEAEEEEDDVSMEDENHLFHYIAQSLSDPDMRVRARAATTAASALYRPSIHPSEHPIIYDQVSNSQAGDPTFAEHYLSYVLWKLNCCIASAKQRQTVIFDLYEAAIGGTEYSDHLQAGLNAVARRLGLPSITALYLPYAPTTTISHDTSRSSAITFVLNTTHRLFGLSNRSAFFTACLEHAGAYMLYCGKIGLFTSACDAAGVLPEDLALQLSVAAAAMAMALPLSNDKATNVSMNKCKAEALALLSSFPGISGPDAAEEFLHSYANGVAAHLWELMDLESSVDEIVAWFDKTEKESAAGIAFAQMMAHDNAKTGRVKAINPAASFQSIHNVCRFLEKNYSSISLHAFTFAAILRLTSLINNAFLVSEQRRYLRALAMLLSVHQGTLQRPLIWEAFLTETITLLLQPDICRTVLSMVMWAFDWLESLSSTPSKLVNIFCQLGEIRIELGGSGTPGSQPNQMGDALEDWIVKMSPKWFKSQISQEAFERAVALWPDSLRSRLSVHASPLSLRDLDDLSQNDAVHNAGQLCKHFLHLADADHGQDVVSVFVDSTFWSLKDKISSVWDKEGINAFQDLLYLCNGEVRAPSLNFYGQDTFSKALNATTGEHKKTEAMNALYHAMCKTMVQLLHDRRPQIRSAAYRCLQRMKPILTGKDLKELPADVSDVVPILVPIPIGSVRQSQAMKLDGVINNATWNKKAEHFATWSLELSRLLCKTASQHDKFFLSFEPLLSTPLLPLHHFLGHFVHAALVCSRSMSSERSKAISEHFETVLQNPFASIEAVRSIVNIVLQLRRYEHPFTSGMLGYNAWLSVNFVDLSKAAVKCGLYVSALLFLELANDQGESLDLAEPRVRQIMYDIYSNVEDPDGFYGIHNKDIRDSLRRRLEHEGLSWQALGWAGAVYNVDGNDSRSAIPVLHHLHDIGLSRLASVVATETRTSGSVPLDDPFFADLSWRTGDWNLPIGRESSATSSGLLYSALSAVHRSKSYESASKIVDKAVRAEMTRLGGLQKEMLTSIQSTVTNLLCLRELNRWLDPQLQQGMQEVIDKGTLRDLQDINDKFEFASAERIIATRLSVFDSVKQRESQDMIGDALTPKMELVTKAESTCHIKLSRLALKSNNLQAAINSLTALQKLQTYVGVIDEAQDVFCEVLWKQGEHTLAIQLLEDLLLREKEKKSKGQRIPALEGRLAHWASEARLKAANEIFGMFSNVTKSIKRSTADVSEHAEIFYQFACFADKQYVSQSSSADVKQLKEYSKLRASQALRLSARQSRARESDQKDSAVREAERDEEKLKKFEMQQKQYLNAALQFYAEAVSMSDNFNDCITRLVTLWLENDENEESNVTFSRAAHKVPSYKFIFLGPQLAARLHRPESPTIFNSTLNGLMFRMSQDHPYHTLYHVIPLLWEHKQPQSTNSSMLGRKSAADDIMRRLASSASNRLAVGAAKSMKRFVAIAMEWTSFFEKDKRLEYKLPSDSPLRKAPRDIPVATSTPSIDVTCQYKDIATFDHFSEWYTRAGGLSRPKVMTCFDSNGQKYTQLFKKDDGFRQDAVMEQIFVLVNDLLNRNRQTRSRKLRYRTYGVLALPEATGVIEFVVGTKPLIKYLPPAHEKYHPKDITSHDFLKAMQEVQSVKNNDEKIIQVWTKLKKRFRPVMRHLFTEKYRDPMAWFSMRLTYARSLAVTSIVGWVLEIGDRHCSNILMDECTGELVHIDFGIAFGAGRILPIPELVPFRLTDDLVDALGVTGVNGTFRQCSQLVLQTLIDSSDVILTILEVFKQDPLHTWMVDDKMKKAQDGNHKMYPERGQEKADRIMRETRENLSKELSVQYRVNQLIQEARDVNNLATIFRGWHSWL